MFNIAIDFLSNTEFSSSTKLVYVYIVCSIPRTSQLSYETIAKATGITRMSAIRCTQHLIDAGLLERTKDSKGWLHYSIKEGV